MKARYTWRNRRKSIFTTKSREFRLWPIVKTHYGHIDWLSWQLWWLDIGARRWY